MLPFMPHKSLYALMRPAKQKPVMPLQTRQQQEYHTILLRGQRWPFITEFDLRCAHKAVHSPFCVLR